MIDIERDIWSIFGLKRKERIFGYVILIRKDGTTSECNIIGY